MPAVIDSLFDLVYTPLQYMWAHPQRDEEPESASLLADLQWLLAIMLNGLIMFCIKTALSGCALELWIVATITLIQTESLYLLMSLPLAGQAAVCLFSAWLFWPALLQLRERFLIITQTIANRISLYARNLLSSRHKNHPANDATSHLPEAASSINQSTTPSRVMQELRNMLEEVFRNANQNGGASRAMVPLDTIAHPSTRADELIDIIRTIKHLIAEAMPNNDGERLASIHRQLDEIADAARGGNQPSNSVSVTGTSRSARAKNPGRDSTYTPVTDHEALSPASTPTSELNQRGDTYFSVYH
jgi:hypothetical protein